MFSICAFLLGVVAVVVVVVMVAIVDVVEVFEENYKRWLRHRYQKDDDHTALDPLLYVASWEKEY